MISFSIDKQRGKVNAEWMSRPVDSIKKSKINQPLASVLISMEQSPTFAYRLKRKLLSGPIIGGAYINRTNIVPPDKRLPLTMRSNIFLLLLVIPAITCSGQTLFFDDLRKSIWTSDEFTISKIKQARQIGLSKLIVPMDSLKINRTIWTFRDELRISNYDCQLKKDSTMAVYTYDMDTDKRKLKITIDGKETLEYDVGIVSTGSFALLMRKRKKKTDR